MHAQVSRQSAQTVAIPCEPAPWMSRMGKRLPPPLRPARSKPAETRRQALCDVTNVADASLDW